MDPVQPDPEELSEVAHLLMRSHRILFITGAGISAESGLPTYRGIGGLYENAFTEEALPIEQALSGAMMRSRPELVWKYLARMEAACRGRHCNLAHRFVAAVEAWRDEVWTLTQNVDGFHAEAGSRRLIEIHGRIHQLACTGCTRETKVASFAGLAMPPRCDCGALLRPQVVLFGEMLPADQLTLYDAAIASEPELIFSIGTTSVFPYIAEPVIQAHRRGIPVVEINPGTTEVSRFVRYRWRCSAVTACQALATAIASHGGPPRLAA